MYYLIMSFVLYQDKFTALHYAAPAGHIDVTKLLLDNGADVYSRDKVSDKVRDPTNCLCK